MLRLSLCLGVAVMSAGSALPPRENIEWANFWFENTNDQKLPRVLLLGDSITWQYRPLVAERLKGIANVDALATSKAISDPAFLKEVAYATADYPHAVIHLNNGLHGWQVTPEEYEAGLRALLAQLRAACPESRLVWASSTPVASKAEGVKLDEGANAVIVARNAIAQRVAEELGLPVNDLYAVVLGELEQLTARKGDLHYNERGKTLQAEAVVQVIKEQLAP
ncbi:MAG: SGNH/GDSL hydrolase family protein [Armatimonadetes bacterium]|nr:SGNH/GDSL hydrolase family protein [Armatimonadota bacterium]